jgi:hypothetical protein
VSLAVEGAFAARWTQTIHAEWIENLLEHQPRHERTRLERTRDLMNRAVRAQRARLKNPPHSVVEMLQVLEAQGLAQSAARLRHLGDLL